MEYILSTFWSILELITIYTFCNSFLPHKQNERKKYFIYFISFFVFICKGILDLPSPFDQITSFILLIIFISFLNGGKFYQRIFILVLSYVLICIVDATVLYVCAAFMQIELSDFIWKIYAFSIAGTFSKLFSIFITWILYQARINHAGSPISGRWSLLSIPFPIASLIIVLVVFNSYRYDSDLSITAVIFMFFLAIANIAILYLIQIVEKNTKKFEEMALLQQQMEIQTENILALEQNYRNQRQASHEFSNQLQTIYDLLNCNNSNAALELIQELQNTQTTRILMINSHHAVIDAILNRKKQVAIDNNIDMHIQVNDLSSVDIPTNILVVLISNLMDNAIEACMRLPQERTIQCCFLQTDSLFISIQNTSLPVTIENGTIQTSKKPKELHGYGLIQIKHLLNNLHAEYTFDYKDHWFQFVAEIP